MRSIVVLHLVKSVQTVPPLAMSASKPHRPTDTEGGSYLSEASWPLAGQDLSRQNAMAPGSLNNVLRIVL